MTYLAAVFDLDGTLVHNIPFHLQAWVEMAKKLGIEMTPERFDRELSGRKNEEIFPALLGRDISADEVTRLSGEKEGRYRELFAPHLALHTGAAELLSALRGKGMKLAIASAAPAPNRQFVLNGLKLDSHFDAVIGGEHARRGKPAPDIFLAAAEALGVAPARCLAFEDAVLGVQAARAAGMDVVGITTTVTARALKEAGAEWTAPDFAQLPPELAARLSLR